jgi:putative hemolysin
MVVISPEDAVKLSPIFKGKLGRFLFKLALKFTGIDHVNELHSYVRNQGTKPGPDFAKGTLDYAKIDFAVGNPVRLESLPEGPFIVIANHVYGHIDGICLIDLIGHKRPKAKAMVNEFLSWIKGLEPNFISVNPTTTKRETTSTSIAGVKSALLQLKENEPLLLFPSGAVADLKPSEGWIIRERDWQDAAIRLIRKAGVPVVPIRFADRNSKFYYLLGLIHYKLRFTRLFHEVFNKKGSHPRVIIGPTISVEEQKAVPEAEFKQFLRDSVYNIPVPNNFINRSELWK